MYTIRISNDYNEALVRITPNEKKPVKSLMPVTMRSCVFN